MTEYYDILRNYDFHINVTGVSAPGASTASEAISGVSYNNISADVDARDMLQISDGANIVEVSKTNIIFTNTTPVEFLYRYSPVGGFSSETTNAKLHTNGLNAGDVIKVYLVIACLPGIGCSGAVITPENHVSAACRFKRVLVEICVAGRPCGASAVGNGAEILLKVTEAAVRGHDAAVSLLTASVAGNSKVTEHLPCVIKHLRELLSARIIGCDCSGCRHIHQFETCKLEIGSRNSGNLHRNLGEITQYVHTCQLLFCLIGELRFHVFVDGSVTVWELHASPVRLRIVSHREVGEDNSLRGISRIEMLRRRGSASEHSHP